MNPDQGTELRSGRVIHSSSGTSSPIDPDMAQSSANDSDNNEPSDISSQLSEIRENYEKKINELQSEFSQLKNLLMAVISKNDENNLPSTSQSSSKPTHRVGLDIIIRLIHIMLTTNFNVKFSISIVPSGEFISFFYSTSRVPAKLL